jgi:hypothetical protein
MQAPGQRVEGSQNPWCNRVGKRVASTKSRCRTGVVKSLAKRVRFAEDLRCQAVRVFQPKVIRVGDEETTKGYKLSRISDGFSLNLGLPREFGVFAIYKRKADKVRPVDYGISDGKSPRGVLNWVERSKESDIYNEPVGEYSK